MDIFHIIQIVKAPPKNVSFRIRHSHYMQITVCIVNSWSYITYNSRWGPELENTGNSGFDFFFYPYYGLMNWHIVLVKEYIFFTMWSLCLMISSVKRPRNVHNTRLRLFLFFQDSLWVLCNMNLKKYWPTPFQSVFFLFWLLRLNFTTFQPHTSLPIRHK